MYWGPCSEIPNVKDMGWGGDRVSVTTMTCRIMICERQEGQYWFSFGVWLRIHSSLLTESILHFHAVASSQSFSEVDAIFALRTQRMKFRILSWIICLELNLKWIKHKSMEMEVEHCLLSSALAEASVGWITAFVPVMTSYSPNMSSGAQEPPSAAGPPCLWATSRLGCPRGVYSCLSVSSSLVLGTKLRSWCCQHFSDSAMPPDPHNCICCNCLFPLILRLPTFFS